MSLNWVMLDTGRNPVPLPNEHIVVGGLDGTDCILAIPASSENAVARKLSQTGTLHVTDQRVSQHKPRLCGNY